jgi:hypothetical protein
MELEQLREIETSRELHDKTDHALSLVSEEAKNEVLKGNEAVSRALLNEDVPLTGEDVDRLWTAANALSMLCEELACRVPEEHRVADE